MARIGGKVMARAARLDALLGEKTEFKTLPSRTFLAETARRERRRPWSTARARVWLRRAVPMVALALATSLGVTLGSGTLTAGGRQLEGRPMALQAPAESFVVPEVTGHPGAVGGERRHLLRQIMALDIAD